MDKFEEIIQATESFVLSSIGNYGFPHNTILTRVFKRKGTATLLFYLNEQSTIVENVKTNPRGTVSCAIHHSDCIETLNLNGTFYIENSWKINKLNENAQKVEQVPQYDQPVIIVFEIMNYEFLTIDRLI